MSGFQIHVPAEFDDDSTVVIPAVRGKPSAETHAHT